MNQMQIQDSVGGGLGHIIESIKRDIIQIFNKESMNKIGQLQNLTILRKLKTELIQEAKKTISQQSYQLDRLRQTLVKEQGLKEHNLKEYRRLKLPQKFSIVSLFYNSYFNLVCLNQHDSVLYLYKKGTWFQYQNIANKYGAVCHSKINPISICQDRANGNLYMLNCSQNSVISMADSKVIKLSKDRDIKNYARLRISDKLMFVGCSFHILKINIDTQQMQVLAEFQNQSLSDFIIHRKSLFVIVYLQGFFQLREYPLNQVGSPKLLYRFKEDPGQLEILGSFLLISYGFQLISINCESKCQKETTFGKRIRKITSHADMVAVLFQNMQIVQYRTGC